MARCRHPNIRPAKDLPNWHYCPDCRTFYRSDKVKPTSQMSLFKENL